MIRTVIFFCISLLCACIKDNTEKSIVVDYSAFGPQVIASEIIGMEWWQWLAHGDSTPKGYDIKVVVYQGITLENIKKKYSVDSKTKKDFRYLEYQAAIRYLDEKINENIIELTTVQLKETRTLLEREIGK